LTVRPAFAKMVLWFPHVGSETQISWASGFMCALMNSAATRKDPVPESACTLQIRFSFMAAHSSPKTSFWVRALSFGGPSIVLYSL